MDLLELAHDRPRRHVLAGEAIVREGDAVTDLFVLLAGELRVEKAGTLVATVTTPGACIGEMSLLLDVPATATVVATSDAELAVMLTREKNAKAEADKAKANLTSKKVSQ